MNGQIIYSFLVFLPLDVERSVAQNEIMVFEGLIIQVKLNTRREREDKVNPKLEL